jgi:hypothetical protein
LADRFDGRLRIALALSGTCEAQHVIVLAVEQPEFAVARSAFASVTVRSNRLLTLGQQPKFDQSSDCFGSRHLLFGRPRLNAFDKIVWQPHPYKWRLSGAGPAPLFLFNSN